MNLILTLDYELWGDGSGNVFHQIIEPTNRILNICDENKIKITIFFEAIEYLKLKEEWEKGNSMGYDKNPIKAIEAQLQNAALNGHDIQLHIHPQWLNAKYVNDKWEVDFSNWRLGDFKVDSHYFIEDLLRDGKEALESIITLVIPEYKCYALRAGWYNIMPSREVYSAMQNLGLKLDSSVYAGGYETGEITRYDYRRIPLNLDYWWASSKDITKISKNKKEIIEVPIFSLMQPRWRKLLTPQKISSIIINRESQISSAVKAKVKNMSLIEKIKFLFKKESFTWDFCLFDLLLHKKYFDYIETTLINKRKFFVLVGHSKSFKNEKAFKKFIGISHNRKYSFHFCTLREIYNDIVN